MKKTILLLAFLVSALTFTSCSDDDSNTENQPTVDALIGKWKVTKQLMDDVEQELGCDGLEGITEYKEDGNFTYEEYSRGKDGNCVFTETFSAKWKSLGNNKYEFTDDQDTWTETIEFSGNTHTRMEVYNGKTFKTIYTKQ